MTKRMLIDDTHPEETRVVVINGNKLEDVEFETSCRKQIKGNIYLGKVMRVEPSLQACFVDYGGNKHGFLAFGEIHPDYYNVSEAELAQIDKEVDDIIEAKKQAVKDREAERERIREEKQKARQRAEKLKADKQAAIENPKQETVPVSETTKDTLEATENPATTEEIVGNNTAESPVESGISEDKLEEVAEEQHTKKRILKKRIRKQKTTQNSDTPKVLAESAGTEEDYISEDVRSQNDYNGDDDVDSDYDEEDQELDFELQGKLMKARKLFHRSRIQDVIKEGQILLIQIVKEERGNKGAALTTYLSLAGRYCVLMPNRIKSGGVSRKITNAADRKRLKNIVKELPLTTDMSMIVRTAGEEKTKSDIVRDYNYLIRSWNQIRLGALSTKAPALIHEEGNLIKRALRDIYTKETAEIIVAGEDAFKMARDFFKILSPHSLKKIKPYRNADMPLFQRFQIESQLDKLHDSVAQLDSGGYLVINPTEALVSIDVNSGRATKEKDLEETALKTNLEACDEIARQLRMRNLAGLVVVDFIDMDEPANNHAIERRMKEALKKDRSRIQVAKMSCFGLLEISRQRMHSSFMESNYIVCPHCQGQGMIRTVESSAVLVLRGIEEEGIKNRSAQLNVFVPSDVAIYLLNQKRQNLICLEQRYKMNVIISADDSIQNINEYRIDRIKAARPINDDKKPADTNVEKETAQVVEEKSNKESAKTDVEATESKDADNRNSQEENGRSRNNNRRNNNRRDGRRNNRRDRRDNRDGRDDNNYKRRDNANPTEANSGEEKAAPVHKEKQEAVILYNSHANNISNQDNNPSNSQEETKEKSTWWKKLIKG